MGYKLLRTYILISDIRATQGLILQVIGTPSVRDELRRVDGTSFEARKLLENAPRLAGTASATRS